MAKRSSKRTNERAKRRAQRAAGQKRPGGESAYARKRDWLTTHGMWGFDVPHPKPWRRGS